MKAGSPYIGKSEIIKDFATKNGIEIKEVNLVGRVGKTEKMKCGLDATIISYRNHDDIDVEFEDKSILEHVAYDDFRKGELKM